MYYWSDEIAGVCVCKMGAEWDEHHKSNLEHALDYICGRLSRNLKSQAPSNSWVDVDYQLRELVKPFVKKYIKDEYKGMARCSSTDTFRYNVGEEIARARCLQAFYSDLSDAIARIGNLLQSMDDVNFTAFDAAQESEVYWMRVENQHR